MTSQSVARSEPIAAVVPALERLIAEVMDEWKIPGLAIAVVQNGEVALLGAYGLRDVEAGLKASAPSETEAGYQAPEHESHRPQGTAPGSSRHRRRYSIRHPTGPCA